MEISSILMRLWPPHQIWYPLSKKNSIDQNFEFSSGHVSTMISPNQRLCHLWLPYRTYISFFLSWDVTRTIKFKLLKHTIQWKKESEVAHSRPTLCDPMDYQNSPSIGFSRQEYRGGLPFPSPGNLPDPGIKPRSPVLLADALLSEPQFSSF